MATMDVEPVFVDTNVLVYGVLTHSPFHRQAMQALEKYERERVEIWISRQILREYLATLSRNTGANPPLTISELVADIGAFESRYRIAEDGASVSRRLLDLLVAVPSGGKQVHDANIVATMLVHGLKRLLTHNVGDFKRFAPWIDLIPLVPTQSVP